MIGSPMKEETIISALQSKLKEDMDTPENVHYNAGIKEDEAGPYAKKSSGNLICGSLLA
jgi:hypothetical protein